MFSERNHGNQHASRYGLLTGLLHLARTALLRGEVDTARSCLYVYRIGYTQAPASTRRRWKCGR